MSYSSAELERIRKKEWKALLYKKHVAILVFSLLVFGILIFCLMRFVFPHFMTSFTDVSFYLEPEYSEDLPGYIADQQSQYLRFMPILIFLLLIMAGLKYFLLNNRSTLRMYSFPFYDAYTLSFIQRKLQSNFKYNKEQLPFEKFSLSRIYDNDGRALEEEKKEQTKATGKRYW